MVYYDTIDTYPRGMKSLKKEGSRFYMYLHIYNIINKMKRNFEIRRVHFEGKDHISCGLVLPHEYVNQMRIRKRDFVKIYQDSSNNKIVIEKLVQEPQNDTNVIGEIVNNTFG